MQRYDVIVWDKVPQKDSEELKTIPRVIGNAKEEENGMLTVFIASGISVSGRFSLSPWKEREE